MPAAIASKSIPEPGVPSPSNWAHLVDRIRGGDPSAMEELYQMFSTGVRFLLYRQLGPQDLYDKVHDVFVIITQAICSGELREPERLMGYVHTVVRRQVASHIDRSFAPQLRRHGLSGVHIRQTPQPGAASHREGEPELGDAHPSIAFQ